MVVAHPLDVPLSPAHLVFFLPFPVEPAWHTKARAQGRGLALKADFLDRLLLVASRFFVVVHPGSQLGKLAQRRVPPLLGTGCSPVVPLLALVLSQAPEGESAWRPKHASLLRLLAHRTRHGVRLACLLVLSSEDPGQVCPAPSRRACWK
jgi:hypothetical protein